MFWQFFFVCFSLLITILSLFQSFHFLSFCVFSLQVSIVVSSQGNPGGIWDCSGSRCGEFTADPTRQCPSATLAYEYDAAFNLAAATIDLSMQWSPQDWGGTMLSAPGGRRCRQTNVQPLEPLIAEAAAMYWLPKADNGNVHTL